MAYLGNWPIAFTHSGDESRTEINLASVIKGKGDGLRAGEAITPLLPANRPSPTRWANRPPKGDSDDPSPMGNVKDRNATASVPRL